ncbi:MG2 domain-containing protein [Pedobacter sp. P351]|uniref:MG2 domain-containing protein n=1 Tax=Pedobacter superstes TaxID=3133441 RepID=UPI0030AB6B39
MYLSRYLLSFFTSILVFLVDATGQTVHAKVPMLVFEKLYLHTDREYYNAGEDLWYKAYLLNGQSAMLTASSDSLSVRLLNEQSETVVQQPVRLHNGLSKGDLRLPKDLPSGNYILRANTAFTSYLGNNLRFEKLIVVYNQNPAVAKNTSTGTSSARTSDTSKQQGQLAPRALPPLSLYPEGGSLIEGVESVVAFKNNSAQHLSGTLTDHAGKVLLNFSAGAAGMGKFKLKPIAGMSYTVKVKLFTGESFTVPVPPALSSGMTISTHWKDSALVVRILTNESTIKSQSSPYYTLAGKNKGKTFHMSKLTIKATSNEVTIKKSEIPGGISDFRLTDENDRPQSERLVYHERAGRPEVRIEKAAADSGVNVVISLKGLGDKAVQGNVSVSVTDESVPSNATDFISYIDLRSEIKGPIDNVRSYFDRNNKEGKEMLDLLLMTRGWRYFLWRRIIDADLRMGKDGLETEAKSLLAASSYRSLEAGALKEPAQSLKDNIRLKDVTIRAKEKIKLVDQVFRPFKTDTWMVDPKDYDHKNLRHYLEHYTYLFTLGLPRLIVDGYAFPYTNTGDAEMLEQILDSYYATPVSAFEKINIKWSIDRSVESMIYKPIDRDAGETSKKGPGYVYVLELTTNSAIPKHLVDKWKGAERNFYQAREFAEVVDPFLTKGVRLNTIFWEPNKITDDKGELTISFPPPEKNKRVRVVVEGITEDSGPVSAEKVLEF